MLTGFGVANFRSIGPSIQLVGPLRKVNILAGQNNAGKSNILRAFRSLSDPTPPAGIDIHIPGGGQFEVAVAVEVDEEYVQSLARQVQNRIPFDQALRLLRQLIDAPAVRLTNDDLIWLRYHPQQGQHVTPRVSSISESQANQISIHVVDGRGLSELSLSLSGSSSGTHANNIARMLGWFFPHEVPRFIYVEAFRQIRDPLDPSISNSASGEGLIHELRRLQNPPWDRQADKQKFDSVNKFLQVVLDDESARLEVQWDAGELLVHRGDMTLPLGHLGTGVHQVVILAATATVIEDALIALEEPEVHLHPLLQRKLVRYLAENTRNQYLIATHSAHMLDAHCANIFHVRSANGATEVSPAGGVQELSDICNDLGYRPSDILQTNAIIWVEGPSDRIYLKRWIELVDPELIEGVHYSLMFYGGRLLSHLSAADDAIDDFIRLRRLNRHISIVIDSDKVNPQSRIGSTKIRLRDEFNSEEYPGFAWITSCRTIENYVPLELLRVGVARIHPGIELSYSGEKWDSPLDNVQGRRLDKVGIAHEISRLLAVDHLNTLDLRGCCMSFGTESD